MVKPQDLKCSNESECLIQALDIVSLFPIFYLFNCIVLLGSCIMYVSETSYFLKKKVYLSELNFHMAFIHTYSSLPRLQIINLIAAILMLP